MFDPDTLENHNEFVEIFNSGNSVANLRGWQIGDDNELDYIQDTGSGLMLAPGQYGVILDASYFANSTSYDNLLPPEALIMTIDDGSFGSYGWSNTLTETVFLTDSAGNSIQVYQYSLGNTPGFSDEKVIMIPDNSEMNWKNSLKFRGTPGFENSVRKKETDIGVDSLWIIPSYPVSGIEFDLKIQVRNLGILPVESFK
ncbi:MAG: lamin tail domain-containing protein, partial [Calditrichaeota bacterium]|nr:lamin tail domain-containing protein [Calditrichota bacterium]